MKHLHAVLSVVLLALLLPLAALASVPMPDAGLDAFLQWYFAQMLSGHAGVAVGTAGALALGVHLLRLYGARLHPAFADAKVAVALTLASATVGAVLTAAVAGAPITLALVVKALVTALLASGAFSQAQVFVPALKVQQVQKAESAGAAAAGAVKSDQDVVAALAPKDG